MTVLDFLTLLCGLAFFMYGMHIMTDTLKMLCGSNLQEVLKKATSSTARGILIGTFLTGLLQSSSAVTVMLVSLVDAAVLGFESTLGIILGSNIGTTLTAWLISLMGVSKQGVTLINLLSPQYFSPIFASVGCAFYLFSKRQRLKKTGLFILGFAILMYGMQFMTLSVSAVQNYKHFDRFISVLTNTFLGLIISTLFTGIIQSSSAAIGILAALCVTGDISLYTALVFVCGANIGTCVTAALAAVKTGKTAKCVAFAHTYINIYATAFCLVAVLLLKPFIGGYLMQSATPLSVAVINTLFNILSTLIILPVKGPFIRLLYFTVGLKQFKEF